MQNDRHNRIPKLSPFLCSCSLQAEFLNLEGAALFAGKLDKIGIIGDNKSFSQFGIDAGATFLGGAVGNATWGTVSPFLNNQLEESLFYLSTQSWISTATQGATNILTGEK